MVARYDMAVKRRVRPTHLVKNQMDKKKAPRLNSQGAFYFGISMTNYQ
jgi:hypothetical protein